MVFFFGSFILFFWFDGMDTGCSLLDRSLADNLDIGQEK